jgi:hypothetical protein
MASTDLNVKLKLKDEASGGIKGFQKAILGVVAAVGSLKVAFDLLKIGARAEAIESAFTNMAKSVNIDAERMKKSIISVSAETVNFSNVAADLSKLMASGLNMETIIRLMENARVQAKLFGLTTEESFKVLSSAVTGGLVTTLRRTFGLNASLATATQELADKMGIATEEVTKHHQAQAIANHILDISKNRTKGANLELKTNFETVQSLASVWLSLKENMGKVIAAFDKYTGVLSSITTAMTFYGDALERISKLSSSIETPTQKITKDIEKQKEEIKKLKEELLEVGTGQQLFNPFGGQISTNKNIRAIKEEIEHREKVLRILESQIKKEEELGKTIAPVSKEIINVLTEAQKERQRQLKTIEDNMYDSNKAMLEMSKETARGMQGNFATGFFDLMKGDINGLGNAFSNFGDYVLRVLSQVISKLIMVKMLQGAASMFGGSGTAVGGLLTEVAGEFADGGRPPVGRASIVGERGPELFVPDSAGTIIPNNKMGGGGGGGGNNIAVASPTVYNITQNIQAPPQMNLMQLSAMIVNEIKSRGNINQAIRSSV